MNKRVKKGEITQAERKNLTKSSTSLIASARNDITIPYYSSVLQPIDDTLLARGHGKGLAIYDEIERDTHAWAALQKRKKTLVAREWRVDAGGKEKADIDASIFIENMLKKLPFDRICEDLLDATLKGFAICEIVWKREDEYIIPKKIVSHDQRRFVFDEDWKPRLLTLANMNNGMELPERKFIVHRHGVKGNNPYGLGLGTRLFWPVLFKREGVTFWLKFLDKFASPTVVGKTPIGMSEESERELLNTLAGLVQESAAVIPIDAEVGFLEAARSGSVSYEDWCKYWDKQISIGVNGESLTADIGDAGSRAASQTHADMLMMLVDSDGDLLTDTLSETLIAWLIEYNFPNAAVPKVYRVRPANEREHAEVRKITASADKEENSAINEILKASAKIEDDEAARAYIISFAVMKGKPESLVDALVKTRSGMNENDSSISNPKKKT